MKNYKHLVEIGERTRGQIYGIRKDRSRKKKGPSPKSLCSMTLVSNDKTKTCPSDAAPKYSDRSHRVRILVREQIKAYLGKDGRYNGLVNILSDPTFLALCYESIRGKPGKMTPSHDNKSLGLRPSALECLFKLGQKVRAGQFDFAPALLIPKPGKNSNPMRPLGINSQFWRIVDQALHLIVSAIYDPIFLDCSHGFRPNRSCHTALRTLYRQGGHYAWAILFSDIPLDSIPHDIIVSKVAVKVCCHRTLELLAKSLGAGYLDPDSQRLIRPSAGTKKGSVLSPLLSNIVLHSLDEFVMQEGSFYNKGRRIKPQDKAITHPKGKGPERTRIRIPSKDPHFLDPRRLLYVRYADDFVVLISGTKKEATQIRASIRNFLLQSLGLEVNSEKTLIRHIAKVGFRFLGAHCKRTRSKHRTLHTRRILGSREGSTERLRICAPIEDLIQKLASKGFVNRTSEGTYQATAKRDLTVLDHASILQFYNQKSRGILNYYTFAANRSKLANVVYLLKMSCALTLALKLKLKTAHKVFKRFGKNLECKTSGTSFYSPASLRAIHLYSVTPTARAEKVID
jgi:retron-type reverse transcriptase